MLKIQFLKIDYYMPCASVYFDNTYEEEWFEDDFVKEMIQDVDGSEVLSPHLVQSPVLGPITVKELSGGIKTLILMLKDDSYIYNASNCGNNCAKWILKIAGKKDLTIFLEHRMDFGKEDFEIEILNTKKLVHNMSEYLYELAKAEEELNREGIF